jgi:hypothetical protein
MSDIHPSRYPEDPQNDGNPNNDHEKPKQKPEKNQVQEYISIALAVLKEMTKRELPRSKR